MESYEQRTDPPVFQVALFTPTPKAAKRVLESFTAKINKDHTRKAYIFERDAPLCGIVRHARYRRFSRPSSPSTLPPSSRGASRTKSESFNLLFLPSVKVETVSTVHGWAPASTRVSYSVARGCALTHTVRTIEMRSAMGISTNGATKSKRFNLRATPKQENLIRVAAKRRGLGVTDFIIESACEKAEQTLSDQAHFVLNQAQWDRFMQALDAPPQVIPQIKKLFAEPPIAESR